MNTSISGVIYHVLSVSTQNFKCLASGLKVRGSEGGSAASSYSSGGSEV